MLPDKEIIEKVLAGDKDLFRLLVQRYQTKLFGICLRLCKDQEKAKEVLQDAFVDIYKYLGSYKYKSSFNTWAYTIVYRKTLTFLKKNGRDTYLLMDEVAGDVNLNEERILIKQKI